MGKTNKSFFLSFIQILLLLKNKNSHVEAKCVSAKKNIDIIKSAFEIEGILICNIK